MPSYLEQKFGLRGKVGLVTGSSQGLGKAMARALAQAVADQNLNGVFTACRAAGKHMLARGSGKIVNIASLLTFFGGITVPGYAASKGAVGQLTKALSKEWAGNGVQVNAIAPGYMATDNTAALRADAGRTKEIL